MFKPLCGIRPPPAGGVRGGQESEKGRELVTSPDPSCRRGTITTQGLAKYLSSPYRGSQRGQELEGVRSQRGSGN